MASRHTPIEDQPALRHALVDIDRANALGWGAYFAVGLRRPGLTRWQRGGAIDLVALPALFVDIDDPSAEALQRLQFADPAPSCIVASGGGYHAYWWLDEPTTDFPVAQRALHALGRKFGGDRLSTAQSLRLPGTRNTKPARRNARCQVLALHERRYSLEEFRPFMPPEPWPARWFADAFDHRQLAGVNADLVQRVADALTASGYVPRGDWLNGACPFPERHKHGDRHPSFGFNTRTGYGYCHVCGTLLLKELCPALGISLIKRGRNSHESEIMRSQADSTHIDPA